MQYVRSVLRNALNQAIRWGMVDYNAAALTTPPKSERFEEKFLNPDEATIFLDAIKDHRLRALFIVGLSLGPRHGEALALRWSDIDLEAGTLHVRRTLQRVGKEVTFGEPKSKSSRRSINLPEILIDELRAHAERQSKERLIAGSRWQNLNLVFPSTIGSPMDMSNSLHQLQAVLEEKKLPRMRFHDLHHTAASLLLGRACRCE